MEFTASNHNKWDGFFFYSYWVLYKLHEQEDRLSLILVLRVPCSAVFCVVAATCEKPKSISSLVNGCTIHERDLRYKCSQKLPWKLVDFGYSCWARKTHNFYHSWNTRSNTFLLDNQRASAWNVTTLFLLWYRCTLLKTFEDLWMWEDEFLNFSILENNLQTRPLVIFWKLTSNHKFLSNHAVTWNLGLFSLRHFGHFFEIFGKFLSFFQNNFKKLRSLFHFGTFLYDWKWHYDQII